MVTISKLGRQIYFHNRNMKILSKTFMSLVSLLLFAVSDTNSIYFWKVILVQTELNFRETYPRQLSLSQCGSLALLRAADNIRLFCLTADFQCLLSNAYYPANYNDSSRGGDFVCYTTIPPLVDAG